MLPTFKQHLADWLKTYFFYDHGTEPLIVRRCYRITRHFNRLAGTPDCSPSQGILKLRNLRSESSDGVFSQDAYIKYELACVRCRNEHWMDYEPTPLETLTAPTQLQPRRIRNCCKRIFSYLKSRTMHPRTSRTAIKERKKFRAACQTMWQAPWMYWDAEAHACKADVESYKPEFKEKLRKYEEEQKKLAMRYDKRQKVNASVWDKEKEEMAGTRFGRTRLRVRRGFRRVRGWVRGLFCCCCCCCKGKEEEGDEEAGNAGGGNASASNGNANANGTIASNGNENARNSPASNSNANADNTQVLDGNANANGTTASNGIANASNTPSSSGSANANSADGGEVSDTPDHHHHHEPDIRADPAAVPSVNDNGEGSSRTSVNNATLVGSETAPESSQSRTSNSNDDNANTSNSTPAAPQPAAEEVQNPVRKNNRKKRTVTPQNTPCFDVFTDLDRFEELNDVVAFMRFPSGDLILRRDWNWEKLKDDAELKCLYSKPEEEKLSFSWWLKRHLHWFLFEPVLYIEDQPQFLQIGAFNV